MVPLSAVVAARERISGRVHVTPVVSSTRLGERAGVRLFLKCENFQKTGSFKVRGVLNKLSQLDREVERRFADAEDLALARIADAQGLGGHSGKVG